ncbi:MAG: transposase [Patiriisocius sp.]|jgi:transposase
MGGSFRWYTHDLAKDVFEVAITTHTGKILERLRLNRAQFHKFLIQREPATVVTEACGAAHHWGRVATEHGHTVRILPAQYVSPYRQRNKTDKADTEALIEANKRDGIIPVPIRSVEQQHILQMHSLREQWKKTKVQRINGLRGCLREIGFFIPFGARSVAPRVRAIFSEEDIPVPLAHLYNELLTEIAELEAKIKQAERSLKDLTQDDQRVHLLQQVPGIGIMTSTAMVASVGNPHRFSNGRKLASWLGLTPLERSSGNRRRLGKISKRGDCYLRMLLTHGARSVLTRAKVLKRTGEQLTPLQQWAAQLEQRVGHNKATCAIANKLARICWAVWTTESSFNYNTVNS